MEIIVEVCRAFALTALVKNRKTMFVPSPRKTWTVVQVEAARQIYKQVQCFTYLGGAVIDTSGMSFEIARRTHACFMRIRRYLRELYDQPKVMLLLLKALIVTTEEIETLRHGCSTWNLRQEHYSKLRTVHHPVLLRIIGA